MLGVVAVYDNVDPDPMKLDEWVISKKVWSINEQNNKPPNEICWQNFWLKNQELWNNIKKNALPTAQAPLRSKAMQALPKILYYKL